MQATPPGPTFDAVHDFPLPGQAPKRTRKRRAGKGQSTPKAPQNSPTIAAPPRELTVQQEHALYVRAQRRKLRVSTAHLRRAFRGVVTRRAAMMAHPETRAFLTEMRLEAVRTRKADEARGAATS